MEDHLLQQVASHYFSANNYGSASTAIHMFGLKRVFQQQQALWIVKDLPDERKQASGLQHIQLIRIRCVLLLRLRPYSLTRSPQHKRAALRIGRQHRIIVDHV